MSIDQISYSIYQSLRKSPLTRHYIDKISYRYRMISPCDSRVIARKTVKVCLLSWFLSIFTFLFIFLTNVRLITLIIVDFTLIIIHMEVVSRFAKMYEISTLIEIQHFIAEVIHYFYVDYRVDDAIYRARDHLHPNMKVAADQIYHLLLAEDKEQALQEYYENIPNKFLRAFVSQCVSAMERGDMVQDKTPLFIKNLENLQRELDIEIDKLQRLSMEFLGVIICVITPVFCIDFVKKFAISIKENMDTFFYGREGFLFDIGLLTIIGCIYVIMRKSAEYTSFFQSDYRILYLMERIPLVRKALDNYCEKYATKLERLKKKLRNNGSNLKPRHFVLQQFTFMFLIFFTSIGLCFYLHELKKNQLSTVTNGEVEILTSAAKENHYESMKNAIEACTSRYVSNKEILPEKEDMMLVLQAESGIHNRVILAAMAAEVERRVYQYQQEYFSFIDLLLSAFLGLLGYYIPQVILWYHSSVSKDTMEDEVNQFNALIYMLMFVDTMTVKQILEEMESFAVVFKKSIRTCINEYSTGDIKALQELKEQESYEPFCRIIDNLIRCDDMPIYQAFHEINVELDGYMTKRKLANEKSIRRRVNRAYILAAIPFVLLFAYGLLPTLLSSMSEINAMMAELDHMTW